MYDMNLRYSVHVSSEMIKESFSSFHCNYHVVILHMKDIFIDIIKKKKFSTWNDELEKDLSSFLLYARYRSKTSTFIQNDV